MPQHFWQNKDFVKDANTTPLGSGPYKIKNVRFGSSIEYERVDDYWGHSHPTNIGRHNFKSIKYIYFLDPSIALESFLAKDLDFRQEYNSKDWLQGIKLNPLKIKKLFYTTLHIKYLKVRRVCV